MIKKMILLASCLLIVGTLSAQTGRILGKVINSKGEPVPKAKLVLRLASRNLSKSIYADDKGNFFQVGLEPQLLKLRRLLKAINPQESK